MRASFFPAVLVAASAVSAASTFDIRAAPTEPIIQFDYPADRGWHADTLSTGPCQGFRVGGRSEYPMSGGFISLEQTRDAHQVQLSYSTLVDPQSVADFTPLMSNFTHTFSGTTCVPAPDLASLGLSSGQDVTFKLEFMTGPRNTSASPTFNTEPHYHCADIKLVDVANYIKPEYPCANRTESTRTMRDSAATTALPKKKKVLTLAEAGGIGAGATLAVVALVLGALAWLGYASFGQKAIARRQWEADAHVMGDRKSITGKSVETNY